MANLSDQEKRILLMASEFLDDLSDRMANAGCNDHWIPNTPENVEMLKHMHELNGDPEEFEEPDPSDKIMYVSDFFLVWYLKIRLTDMAKEGQSAPMYVTSHMDAEEGEG